MKFDDSFFSPNAEGNLASAPSSFLQSSQVRSTADHSWSLPVIPQVSILATNMRSYACPTLNSFAAFAADSAMDPNDPEYHADVSQVSITQPASSTGNFWKDNISGIVKTFTPVANQYLGTNNTAMMQQYLQGKLPGYTLDSKGNLVKKTDWVPFAILGAVGIALVVFASKR